MSELGVRLRVFDLESCIHTLEPHSVGAELPFLYHFFSRARLDQVSGLEHYPVHNASPGGRLNHSAVFSTDRQATWPLYQSSRCFCFSIALGGASEGNVDLVHVNLCREEAQVDANKGRELGFFFFSRKGLLSLEENEHARRVHRFC